LIAAIDDGFAFIDFAVLEADDVNLAKTVVLHQVILQDGEKRFNEGVVDPSGRFLAGTMGMVRGTYKGRLFALEKGRASATPIKEGITCTNGMAWTDGGTKMYAYKERS